MSKKPHTWATFSAELKKLWEREGAIEKSLALIEQNSKFKLNEGRTGRRQIARAIGEFKLVNGDVQIPSRANGALYNPVANRVMYCIYSTPVFNSNGYSTRSRGVANGMKAAGADVVVVARAGYPWDWKTDCEVPAHSRFVEELDGVSYVHLPNGDMGALSPSQHVEMAADAFVREAMIQRPEVIQTASNYRVALPALIAARRLGIPFVYEVRGLWEITGASNNPSFFNSDRYTAMKDLESRVAREADLIFAITQQVADELVLRGVDPERIRLAPNAVDPDTFYPRKAETSYAAGLGLETNLPTIGFAGSIVMYEGLETLLRASEILNQRGVRHQIAIGGSGNTEARLREVAKEGNMSWVRFLGRLPQNDIPKLLSAFDIIVTPRDSTVITELVSALKPLEAFASGRATVLSDVAPNVDLAGVNGERAALFKAGDSESFADVLEELINDPARRIELAKEARRWIESERTWSSIGQKMRDGHVLAKSNFASSITESSEDYTVNDLEVACIISKTLWEDLESSINMIDVTRGYADDLKNVDILLVEYSELKDKLFLRSRILNGDQDFGSAVRSMVNSFKAIDAKTVLVARPSEIKTEGELTEEFIEVAKCFDLIVSPSMESMLSVLENVHTQFTPFGSFVGAFVEPQKSDGSRGAYANKLVVTFMGDESDFVSDKLNEAVSKWSTILSPDLIRMIKTSDGTNGGSWTFELDELGEKLVPISDADFSNTKRIYIDLSSHRDGIQRASLGFIGDGLLVPQRSKVFSDWFPDAFERTLEDCSDGSELRDLVSDSEAFQQAVSQQVEAVKVMCQPEVQMSLLARQLGIPVSKLA